MCLESISELYSGKYRGVFSSCIASLRPTYRCIKNFGFTEQFRWKAYWKFLSHMVRASPFLWAFGGFSCVFYTPLARNNGTILRLRFITNYWEKCSPFISTDASPTPFPAYWPTSNFQSVVLASRFRLNLQNERLVSCSLSCSRHGKLLFS